MPKIIVSIEGVVVREVRLSKDRTTLGRRPYNDVVFDNLAVSGEHAVIALGDGEYTIEDLSSTNGTYVNGRSISRHTLRHGDSIEIGKYWVKFYQDHREDDHERVTVVDDGEAIYDDANKTHGRLLILNGHAAGKSVELKKPNTTIGKAASAVISIAREPYGHSVAYLEGTENVMLNGEPLTSHASPLESGDLIEIGGVQMEFHRL